MLDQFLWVVIAGGIACFAAAMGIGANDCGNAMASSVGAKSLMLAQAVLISAVFEFLGAFLLGSHVTETIRKGITDAEQFADRPDLLMFGMFAVVISVAAWLALATALALPVSTTHTAVGGVIGVAVVARGWEAVQWDQVGLIVVSWFASPLLSGLASMALYGGVRAAILRSSRPAARALLFFPVLVGVTTAINAFFILYKGLPVFPELSKTPVGIGLAASAGFGVVCGLLTHLGCVPAIRRSIAAKKFPDEQGAGAEADTTAMVSNVDGGVEAAAETPEEREGVALEMVTIEAGADRVDVTSGDGAAAPAVGGAAAPLALEPAAQQPKTGLLAVLRRGVTADIHAEAEGRKDDSAEALRVREMHAAAERFSDRTEHTFTYLQVFTACLDALSHGANDTANSLGPFAAVFGIYMSGTASDKAPVPMWILALGGGGIVVGLALFGYRIIEALGTKMTKITPSRGFAIELGAALVIITGSRLGIPLSTTHCQVGSTVALGLLEKDRSKGVNWPQLLRVAIAWVATLVFAAAFSGMLYAFAVYAPSALPAVLGNVTTV